MRTHISLSEFRNEFHKHGRWIYSMRDAMLWVAEGNFKCLPRRMNNKVFVDFDIQIEQLEDFFKLPAVPARFMCVKHVGRFRYKATRDTIFALIPELRAYSKEGIDP